ncbi:MAG: hypothetical protein ACRBFS_04470, partial [Aureispira sp.]
TRKVLFWAKPKIAAYKKAVRLSSSFLYPSKTVAGVKAFGDCIFNKLLLQCNKYTVTEVYCVFK